MNKPSIPELPETIEELESLFKEKFKILYQSNPISATHGGKYHPGDIALIIAEKECPFCEMQFRVTIKRGCFGGSETPHVCPNCHFPQNVLSALVRKRILMRKRIKRNKKKKEG